MQYFMISFFHNHVYNTYKDFISLYKGFLQGLQKFDTLYYNRVYICNMKLTYITMINDIGNKENVFYIFNFRL